MLNELIIQMWGKATQTSVNDFACVYQCIGSMPSKGYDNLINHYNLQ